MSVRRFCYTFVCSFLVLLLLFASFVFAVDPFRQYHSPWFGLHTRFTRGTQAYVNPGLAKNEVYDSILLGSSVSENFKASWFDDFFDCTTLKLPYAGAYTNTYTDIMRVAFDTTELRNVFYCLDQFAFLHDVYEYKYDLPLYLYDRNPLNDVNYLLNRDVIGEITKMVEYSHGKRIVAIDDSYSWQKSYKFTEDRVLEQYNRPNYSSKKLPKEYYKSLVQRNLELLIPIIEEHEYTNFYFFFPPYSILWWDQQNLTGRLDAMLWMTQYIIETLQQYPNVAVYYFQNQPWIICDLNNYRESMHFSQDINLWEAQCLAEGQFRVNIDDVVQVMHGMKNTALAFDYEAMYGAN